MPNFSKNKNSKLILGLTALIIFAPIIFSDVLGTVYAQTSTSTPQQSGGTASRIAELLGWIGDFVGGFSSAAILLPIAAIFYALGLVGSGLVWLAGWTTDWGVELNNQLLSPDNATLYTGWRVARDIANLGFVLAIIFIAFLTILRAAGYNTKQMLARLIVVALLINFSLVIAGVIIDFAGVITNFFLDKINPPGAASLGLSTQIAAAFQPQALLEASSNWEKIIKSIASFREQVRFVAGTAFATFLTFVIALALLTLAVMLFLRFVVLTMLLAIAPIAWLLWVWPGLSQHFRSWWSEFLRWVFFLPSATFFLYLALQTAVGRSDYFKNLARTPNPTTPDFGMIADLALSFGQILAMCGFLLIGLTLSYKVGGLAGQIAERTGGWVIGKSTAYGKRAGMRYGSAPFRSEWMKRRLEAWSEGKDVKGRPLGGVKRLATSLASRPIYWAQRQGESLKEEHKKRLQGKSEDELALRYATATAPQKAAITELLAERGKLNKLPSVDIKLATAYGISRQRLISRNPLLDEEIQAAVAQNDPTRFTTALSATLARFRSEDWKNIDWNALMKGVHTSLAGQPEWEQFRPLVARAIFESRIINGRETNPLGTNDIAQLFRQLPPEERRRIKEEVDKLSQAGIPIKQNLRNYIDKSLWS